MSEQLPPIPRPALIGAGVVIAASLAFAAVGRLTGIGKLDNPTAAAVRTLDVRFSDLNNGGIAVRHADGRPLTNLAPGTNGFIRGVVRSLARTRRLGKTQDDPPFRLTQWSDHRLTIDDPATGQSIELTGFGRDNRAAFARLLVTNATMAEGSER